MKDTLNYIILKAVDLKATDIHFNYKNNAFICELRIFGKLVLFEKFKKDDYRLLVNYIRYISQLETIQIYEPQTGGFTQQINNHSYFFRTSYLKTSDSEAIVLRILNQNKLLSLADLTYDLKILDSFEYILKQESGLVLFSGPTGSGKSTTVYTLLEHLTLKQQKSIVTIEDPIEKKVEGVLQLQLNEKQGNNYEQLLKQILRHDPDIILVGEIRDTITARLTQRCALTGHLVITTLHAFDVISAVKRIIELGVNQLELQTTLKAIFCQRLLYHRRTHQPFCLYEMIDDKQIMMHFKNELIEYATLKQKANHAFSKGYIDEEQTYSFT